MEDLPPLSIAPSPKPSVSITPAVDCPELKKWKESTGAVILSQGAEAIVYKATMLNRPAIVKERFSKTYRHPVLDEKINTRRLKEEARVMLRARQGGVDVPTIYLVDKIHRLLFMELIEGATMKSWLHRIQKEEDSSIHTLASPSDVLEKMMESGVSLDEVASRTGKLVATLHKANLIHGDLTTSNFLLRASDLSVVLIDFGLSYTSTLTEDRAVDLYVLERAFLSTHTDMTDMFQKILAAYAECGFKDVVKRLDDVRQRGRKKIAFG